MTGSEIRETLAAIGASVVDEFVCDPAAMQAMIDRVLADRSLLVVLRSNAREAWAVDDTSAEGAPIVIVWPEDLGRRGDVPVYVVTRDAAEATDA